MIMVVVPVAIGVYQDRIQTHTIEPPPHQQRKKKKKLLKPVVAVVVAAVVMVVVVVRTQTGRVWRMRSEQSWKCAVFYPHTNSDTAVVCGDSDTA